MLFFAFTDNQETRSDFQSQTHSSSVIVAIKMLTPSFVTRLSAEIIYNAFLLRLLSLATLPLQHLTVLNTISFHVGCKHAKHFGLCSPLNSWGGSSHILFETKSCTRPSTSKKEARDQEEAAVVVGVLIKGMDYLFASWRHFAFLPNSCCGLSTALAWLPALHWLYCRHIWSYTQVLLLTDAITAPVFPQEFVFLSGWKSL